MTKLNKIPLHFGAMVILAGVFLPDEGRGGDVDPKAESPPLEVHIEPSFWLPSVRGDIAVGSVLPKLHIDRSFDTFPSDMSAAGGVAVTARRERFGVSGDFYYADTTTPAEVDGESFAAGSVEREMFYATVVGSYRAESGAIGHVDLLAGARVWAFDTTLSLNAGNPEDDVSVVVRDTWVDPIIGVSGQLNLSDRIFAEGYADVGGLIANDSFTYQLRAALGYSVTDRLDVSVGGRWLGVRHDDGNVSRDLDFSGPSVSASTRF